MAVTPTAPAWVKIDSYSIKRNEKVELTWGGAEIPEGMTAYYTVQYRRYDGQKWTTWTDAEYRNEEFCHCEPTKLFPDLKGGDYLDVRIGTVAVSGGSETKSEFYKNAPDYVSIIGGGIRIVANQTLKEGIAYVNADGAWKEGKVFTNVNGKWHEGI